MYERAKQLGYKPQEKAQAAEKEVVIKPDLDRVAANRARNAGTAAANGNNDRAELTMRTAAEMTNAEFAKLTASEKKRLFGG